MQLVKVTSKHKNEFCETHSKSLRESYQGFLPDGWVNRTAANCSTRFDNWFSDKRADMWLCFDDCYPIGFVVFGKLRDEDALETDGEIWSVYFRESAKGKGYAKQTFEFAERELIKKGCKRIFVWCLEANTRARKFYEEKNGYTMTDVWKNQDLDGVAFKELRLEKVVQ
jgi:GNAT superfamily N-acetyltransferase